MNVKLEDVKVTTVWQLLSNEKYEAMKNALDQVEHLKFVTVNGQKYNVKNFTLEETRRLQVNQELP